jgi:hypothetical protein
MATLGSPGFAPRAVRCRHGRGFERGAKVAAAGDSLGVGTPGFMMSPRSGLGVGLARHARKPLGRDSPGHDEFPIADWLAHGHRARSRQ